MGFTIALASQSGGKAGSGYNRTSTVQVRDALGDGFLLLAQFRFPTDDAERREAAFAKARRFVETHLTRALEQPQVNTDSTAKPTRSHRKPMPE